MSPGISLPTVGMSSRQWLGVGFILCSSACFAMLDTTAQYVGMFTSAWLMLWVRYSCQALATTAVFLPARGWALVRTQHLGLNVLRGLLLLTASSFCFFGLRYIPVAEFTAIGLLTPMVVTFFAAIWLKEHVSRPRWLLMLGSLCGAIIIVRPGQSSLLADLAQRQHMWALMLPFGMVIAASAFQLLTAKLARHEDATTMHFYTGWVGAVAASVVLSLITMPHTTGFVWACMLFAGAAATVGHFLLIQAFARTPASTLAPFQYLQIGFAVLCGWLVFGRMPDHITFVGIGLVALCGAASAWLAAFEGRTPSSVVAD
jgi:drug/metabolite transporter (DMT)-like permease